ncbi:MAG: type VI secretion system tip protein TssI/VgrG [Burkholderiales bacterium]|nr:type VI secretion system tip protein TssI/VgrG [Burkholderiales bacterium]
MLNPCQIKTPLPEDALRLSTCVARESLSILGDMDVTVLGKDPNISADKLLGKAVTVSVLMRDETTRELSGYVTRFTQSGTDGAFYVYQMTVRPWLWMLTRTADCRIFQDMSVPDIVKSVFADHPVADFELKLFRSYRKWNYCVQYRETDFNFVARLLEHEGIYWYFEHAKGKHKLVLVDASSAHDSTVGHGTLPYYGTAGQLPPDIDCVNHWAVSREVEPGKVVLTDHDFERPSTSLKVDKAHTRSYDLSDAEVFDYPGGYTQTADGAQYAESRMEELQSEFEVFHGAANTVGVRVGHTLKLQRHPREDQNAEYLVTATTLHIQHPGYESDAGPALFQCDFGAIVSGQQYRPTRRTPKPCVNGPQTAVVVGPSGEEIFTDKYGRVKVQFYWDRRGTKNEKSSCWVSVSHPWAGKNFGVVHIPRIGQEVIVGFLEGDPDRPIIIGRVYNAEQMPPWELPANATQSGILTRSSKGGGYANANALRFEDKKGSEQLWIHAEKNQDIEVENDETHWVGHDRRKTVDHDETVHVKHDRTETVDHNETITIGVDRTESVGHNETISIGSNRSVSVGASETKTVAMQRSHAVGINESIAIGAAQEVAIGAYQTVAVGSNQDISVGSNQSTSVGADQSATIGANRTVEVGKDLKTVVAKNEVREVGEARTTKIGKDDKWQVGKKFYLEAADEITLKTGDASIVMKKNGTIQIKGKDITITGSGKIGIKASGDMTLKGSKIAEN